MLSSWLYFRYLFKLVSLLMFNTILTLNSGLPHLPFLKSDRKVSKLKSDFLSSYHQLLSYHGTNPAYLRCRLFRSRL